MIAPVRSPWVPGDAIAAWSAAAACGLGAVAAFHGAASASVPVAVAGAALVTAGLVVVLAGRWLEPLILLAVALPLPPVFSRDDVRVSAALLITAVVVGAGLLGAPAMPRSRNVPPVRSAEGPAHALPVVPALVLLAAVLVSAAVAGDRMAALRELLNWLLLGAVLLLAVRELRVRPSLRPVVAHAIAAAAAVAGLFAVLQMVGVLPGRFPIRGSGFYRASLGFGWPNELGMFFALALPFAVLGAARARTPATRALGLAAAAAIGAGLLATFSRASWLAVLLAPAVLFTARAGRLALRMWVSAIVFALLADLVSGGALQARILSTIGDWVVEQRAALTLAGIMMFAAHPLTGVGPGGFASSLESYGPRISWLWDYLPTAQNGFVQMAAESGAPGLLALIVLLAAVFRRLVRAARAAPAAAPGLEHAALWSFATAVLLAFNEWIFVHGIAQLIVLAAAIGLTAPRFTGAAQ